MNKRSSIQISEETRDILSKFGEKKDSYETIIKKLMNGYSSHQYRLFIEREGVAEKDALENYIKCQKMCFNKDGSLENFHKLVNDTMKHLIKKIEKLKSQEQKTA